MKELNTRSSFCRALPAPEGLTVPITDELIEQVVQVSRCSPRRRILLNLSGSHQDTLQRMLNALQPGSYIQPHRHLTPPKAESIIVLRGSVASLIFNEQGKVIQCVILAPRSGFSGCGDDCTKLAVGIDIRPALYHTFLALAADTVIFEVKPGPYDEQSDKDFAVWAPREGSPLAGEYFASLCRLAEGGQSISPPSQKKQNS